MTAAAAGFNALAGTQSLSAARTRRARDETAALTNAVDALRRAILAVPALNVPVRTSSALGGAVADAAQSIRAASASSSSTGSPRVSSVISKLTSVIPGYAGGGRVSAPVIASLAEQGAPEYVIPARDRARALPLIRDLLSELASSAPESALYSPAARQAQPSRSALPPPAAAPRIASSAGLCDTAPVQITVNAPCTFHVSVPSQDPQAVGEAVCEAAERTLARTLGNALCAALHPAPFGLPTQPG